MTNPSQGDTVTVHFILRLADGSVVQSTREGDPIDITLGTLGAQHVIPGIERALLDMAQHGTLLFGLGRNPIPGQGENR